MGWVDGRVQPDAAALCATDRAAVGIRASVARRPAVSFLPGACAAGGPATLGDIRDWLAEWKYDGIRAQLVRRSGQSWLWSRGEDLITDRFPEISAVPLPDGTVIDGEMVIWQNGMPALFADLQKRIGRKTLGSKMLLELPAALIAYDLLEQDGDDLRRLPQRERRRGWKRW
jgi:DNA ligase-1